MFSHSQDNHDFGQSGVTVCAWTTSLWKQMSFHTCHNFPFLNHDEWQLDALPVVVCCGKLCHSRCICEVFRPSVSSSDFSDGWWFMPDIRTGHTSVCTLIHSGCGGHGGKIEVRQ